MSYKLCVPLSLLWLGAVACNDLSGLSGSQPLPSGTPNPSSFNTPAGALALYNTALYTFQYSDGDPATVGAIGTGQSVTTNGTFVDFVLATGLLSDELQAGNVTGVLNASSLVNPGNYIDARQLPEGTANAVTDAVYGELDQVRGLANEGIGALAAYDSSASPDLRGQLYALQGYTEIFLADLFCSGVPLSTLDFKGDYTYHAGSTTTQLYQAAIAKFDTALTLSTDSTRILNLVRVGRGRAWLDLAQYDSAAAAVANVPTGYSYQFLVDWAGDVVDGGQSVLGAFGTHGNGGDGVSVSNLEGGTGLPYLSSGDPRTASAVYDSSSDYVYAPLKYGGATISSGLAVDSAITVADWIEARLIQAEAAYHGIAAGQGSWLDQLNALRQTAITPALPPLSDPGTDSARVALLFQERAYWLFLTGHRQGDLRRLLRNYNQIFFNADAVYPTGPYPFGGPLSFYGEDVTAPVPSTEHANPLFTGCLSRGA